MLQLSLPASLSPFCSIVFKQIPALTQRLACISEQSTHLLTYTQAYIPPSRVVPEGPPVNFSLGDRRALQGRHVYMSPNYVCVWDELGVEEVREGRPIINTLGLDAK